MMKAREIERTLKTVGAELEQVLSFTEGLAEWSEDAQVGVNHLLMARESISELLSQLAR